MAIEKKTDVSAVPAVGDFAPDLALDDAHGKSHRLSELTAGGLLVLVFYRGHW